MLRDLFEKIVKNLREEVKKEDVFEWVGVDAPSLSGADKLQHPDPRPCTFDASVDAWLYRISTWGRLKFKYRDTMFRKSWSNITKSSFVKKLQDPEMMKLFGQFGIDWVDVNKVRIYRKYEDLYGKKQEEEFMVEIALKPHLKKLLKKK